MWLSRFLLRTAFLISGLALIATPQTASPPVVSTFTADFTHPTSSTLDRSLWTVNSPLITKLAVKETGPAPPVVPDLKISFSPQGMSVSGVSAIHQFAGVELLPRLKPPFTLQATVMGVAAHANPFALYLVHPGNPEKPLRVTGNLDPANAPAYRIAAAIPGEPAKTLDPKPSAGKWYTIAVAVGPAGFARVYLYDEGRNTIGHADGINFGKDEASLLLVQSEPNPRVAGPNEAVWRDLSILHGIAGAPDSPVSLSLDVFSPPAIPLWTPATSTLAAFDLNGAWELDEGSKVEARNRIQKVLVYQMRDRLSSVSTEPRQPFPGSREFLWGDYTSPASVDAHLIRAAATGELVQNKTTVTVKDEDHIQFENWSLASHLPHRVRRFRLRPFEPSKRSCRRGAGAVGRLFR